MLLKLAHQNKVLIGSINQVTLMSSGSALADSDNNQWILEMNSWCPSKISRTFLNTEHLLWINISQQLLFGLVPFGWHLFHISVFIIWTKENAVSAAGCTTKCENQLLYIHFFYQRCHSWVVRAAWLWCRKSLKGCELEAGLRHPRLENSVNPAVNG